MRTVAVTTLMLLAACSGSKGGGRVDSCELPGVHNCREWRDGHTPSGEARLKTLCETGENVYRPGQACPTEHVIGRCARADGIDVIYEGYGASVTDYEGVCRSTGGAFSAP
jgi:hypothetical protein